METGYKIVYAGHLRPDVDQDQFVREFSQRFGVAEAKARQLTSAVKEVLIKRGLTRDQAQKYYRVLADMGMVVRLEPAVEAAPAEPESSPEKTRGAPGPAATDPYAAPAADLIQEPEDGEMTGPSRVPAGHGWTWLARGFWHFRQNPLQWIVAIVVWVVLAMLVGMVPLLGSLAVLLFSPVVTAGFMIGAKAQDEGGGFEVGHLFAGFSHNLGQLILVGLLYFLGAMAIGVLSMLLFGGGLVATLGGMEGMQQLNPEDVNAAMVGSGMLLVPLVMLALLTPLLMAYWFAPALVALDGMSATSAMKMSFVGCSKNMLPFLVYGLIALVLLILGGIPIMLGWLVVIPMLTASIYVAYRDIYYS